MHSATRPALGTRGWASTSYGDRNGIHILDSRRRFRCSTAALNVIRETVAKNGRILFVGHQAAGPAADRRGWPNAVAQY